MNVIKILFSLFFFAIVFNTTLSSQDWRVKKEVKVEDNSQHIYNKIDRMPRYKGGEKEMNKFLRTNLQQIDSINGERIIGRSTIKFIVEPTGELNIVGVLKGIDERSNKEAMRLLKKMPKWEPGIHRGKKVRVYYTLQFYFE